MHILFDLDGTLFQARDITLITVKAVYKELGILGVDDTRIVESIGRPLEEFLENVFPDIAMTDEILDLNNRYERQVIREQGTLFPGISDILRQLADEGHTLCVVSNGSMEYIELVLQTTGIRTLFGGIYSARFHDSKAKFVSGLLMPGQQAVFIGDSFDDIEAGLENKIPAIAALYGYGNKDCMKTPTFAVSTPDEITGCIHQLDMFSKIVNTVLVKGIRVIGINGIDTSGKTLFSDKFARYLNDTGYQCVVIHIDDFHNPLEIRRRGSNEIDAYYNNAFNYKQLIDEVLEPLRHNGNINKDVMCLNVETDKYEIIRHYEIERGTILLLEGVLLFRPPVSEFLDGRIFLHIDFKEMLKRARDRDVPKYGEAFFQKYINKYIPVQKRYLDEYEPSINCDIFIDNTDFSHPILK